MTSIGLPLLASHLVKKVTPCQAASGSNSNCVSSDDWNTLDVYPSDLSNVWQLNNGAVGTDKIEISGLLELRNLVSQCFLQVLCCRLLSVRNSLFRRDKENQISTFSMFYTTRDSIDAGFQIRLGELTLIFDFGWFVLTDFLKWIICWYYSDMNGTIGWNALVKDWTENNEIKLKRLLEVPPNLIEMFT